jgi:hypothetical protein
MLCRGDLSATGQLFAGVAKNVAVTVSEDGVNRGLPDCRPGIKGAQNGISNCRHAEFLAVANNSNTQHKWPLFDLGPTIYGIDLLPPSEIFEFYRARSRRATNRRRLALGAQDRDFRFAIVSCFRIEYVRYEVLRIAVIQRKER